MAHQKIIESLVNKVKHFETIGFEAGGRPDLPAYQIIVPFNWGIDPYNDRNWKFQLNTLRYLRIYTDLFVLTKEQHYLDKYLSFIEDWANFSQKNDHEFAWNDMATGIRSENIALLLEVLKDHGKAIPHWLNDLVLLHVDRMSAQGFIKTDHNHGLYVIHGLRMLTPYISTELQQNILTKTKHAMVKLFASQYDEHFIHKEHSPHYHHLITESLGRHLKTGLYQDIDFLYACYDSALKNQKNFYLPDGREIPFGDTDGASNPHKKFVVESCWEFFNQSGYFIAKNINGSYLAVTNNYHSNVHKHADNLSFILGYCGQDYLTDPGKYKYAKDPIRKEIIASSSHSVVNVKKSAWKSEDIITPITDFTYQTSEGYFLVQGSVSLKRSLGVKGLWRKKHKNGIEPFCITRKVF